MEDQNEQPRHSFKTLNDADFVRRFLSNAPKDRLAGYEVGAVVRYLKGIIKARYGAYFSPSVAEDLAEDALVEAVTSRPSFKGDAKLTTWMGTIAFRIAYCHAEKNFKEDSASDGFDLEPKSRKHGDERDADATECAAEEYAAEEYPATDSGARGLYPVAVSYDAPHWRDVADKIYASDGEIEDVAFLSLLDEATKQLTQKEARAFQAIVVRQAKYQQYADQENMTVTAVRSLVSDAKRKLRHILNDQFKLNEPD